MDIKHTESPLFLFLKFYSRSIDVLKRKKTNPCPVYFIFSDCDKVKTWRDARYGVMHRSGQQQ